jgi:hypothetical protein
MAWTVRAREGVERCAGAGRSVIVASLSMAHAYPVCLVAETTSMRRSKVEPEQLLAAIADAVDDGFYPASSLASVFPKLGHRELVRLRNRAMRQGLVLERRGPDGRTYLALSSEGWQALRALREPSEPR